MRLIDADKLYIDDIPLEHKDYCTRESVGDWIESQPTVDPVKHGKWVKPVPGDGENHCSACKSPQPWFVYSGYQEFDFCPYCGAKMDAEI